MRLTLPKEVFIFALIFAMRATVDVAVNNQNSESQNDIIYSNGIATTTIDDEIKSKTDANNSVESQIIKEIDNSDVVPAVENPIPNDITTIIQEPTIDVVNQTDKAQEKFTGYFNRVENEIVASETQPIERTATGYFDQVEKSIINQGVQTASFIIERGIKYRLTLLRLIFFLSSTIAIFGFIVLVITSVYYRICLKQNKCAPFEAPDALRILFPKPVNYEYEINNLCSKYLDN